MGRMKGYQITTAREYDRHVLTEIAFSAKRHWNYPEEWIQLWTDQLTISAPYIRDHYVFKLVEEASQEIVGFCALEHHRIASSLEIAHAWIRPDYIGKHLGEWLVNFALSNLQSLPVNRYVVTADPHVTGFYEKLGFTITHTIASKPLGRWIPVMEMIK